MERKTALVAGANGIIGRNLVERLRADGNWDVIGVSRRSGLAVDLLDADDTRAKIGALTGVTHLFYAAYQDRPTWAELVPPNLAMLTNLVDALDPAALEHVSLMQGYKVYGAHLGPFKTPARETDAGHMPPEFNVDQQRFLERRGGSWSAIRPSVVGGTALGNPMNLALVIAVYASISKELGLPLRFPGKPGAYDSLLEMTDAGLLADATVWATKQEGAFNIANGDLFRWSELWPKLAAYFGLEAAPPFGCPLWTSWPTRLHCGLRWRPNTTSRRPMRTCRRPGRSATSCSAGTTTCSRTRPSRAARASTLTSRPSRCSTACSTSSARRG